MSLYLDGESESGGKLDVSTVSSLINSPRTDSLDVAVEDQTPDSDQEPNSARPPRSLSP